MDLTMDDRELQNLLTRWRAWSCSGGNGLGFSNSTVEHRLMCQGVTDKVTGSHDLEDEECEVLDCAISNMPSRMKKVIKLKYLFGWLNKDAAKTLNMSLASYKSFLIQSRAWLCGHLSNSKIK